MPLPAAALLLVAAVQASPPPRAAPAPSADEQIGGLAASAFAFVCLERLGVAASPADYASGSADLGVKIARDHPETAGQLHIDGADGRGCRVRYTGPLSERMWGAFTRAAEIMTPTPDGGGCRITERTDVRLRAACIDTGPKPPRRSALELDRSAAGPGATVTATLAPPPF